MSWTGYFDFKRAVVASGLVVNSRAAHLLRVLMDLVGTNDADVTRQDEHGYYVWPSMDWLAEHLGSRRELAADRLDELNKDGLIRVLKSNGRRPHRIYVAGPDGRHFKTLAPVLARLRARMAALEQNLGEPPAPGTLREKREADKQRNARLLRKRLEAQIELLKDSDHAPPNWEGQPPLNSEGQPPPNGEGSAVARDQPPPNGEGQPPPNGEGQPPPNGEGQPPPNGGGISLSGSPHKNLPRDRRRGARDQGPATPHQPLKKTRGRSGAKLQPLPDDFEPNAEDQTVAEKRGVDLEHCFDKFMRVIRLQPKLSADWHTEFQLFLLREKPEPRDLARSLFARSQRLRGEERDGVDQPNCGLTVLEIFDRQPTSKPIEPKPKRKLTDWHKERARQLATDKLGLEGELVEAIIRDVEAEGGGPATLMRRCQAAGREKVDEQRAVAN